jgi:hypothetical protein
MPFFMTGFFPCFLVLVGMWLNNKRFDRIDSDLSDIKNLIQHFVDRQIVHEGRIATVEERTKSK